MDSKLIHYLIGAVVVIVILSLYRIDKIECCVV